MRVSGVASERIPGGASVLVRCGRVFLADAGIANAVAHHVPIFGSLPIDDWYEPGQHVPCLPWVDAEKLDLQAIAAGPIRDPNTLYLPAGKLSEDDYQKRLARQFTESGISRDGQP